MTLLFKGCRSGSAPRDISWMDFHHVWIFLVIEGRKQPPTTTVRNFFQKLPETEKMAINALELKPIEPGEKCVKMTSFEFFCRYTK